jgi:hypothetical protein
MHCPDIYAVGFTVPVDVIWSMWTDDMLPTKPPGLGSFILSADSVTVPTGNPVVGSQEALTLKVTLPVNPPGTRLGMCTRGAPDEVTLIPLVRLHT